MRKVRTWATYERSQFDESKPMGESMTIPDQAVSIKQILLNHSNGMPLPPERKGQYFGDSDHIPDFEQMDKLDILDWQAENQARIAELQAEVKKAQEAEKRIPIEPEPAPPDPQPQPAENQ